MNEELNKPIDPDRVAQINAEIAAQGNKGYSVAPSFSPNAPITSESLQGATPLNLPSTQTSTAYNSGAALAGTAEGQNASLLALKDEEAKRIADAQANVETST